MTSPRPVPALPLPDQTGRTWLVTGATHGVGTEVARAAARAGARVLLTARDRARGESVRSEIGAAGVVDLDLASQDSVRAAAASVTEPVDVLVDNAGTVAPTRTETVDGHELLLATNFLGPFALTNLLLDRVRERVVIVGSGAHKAGRVDQDDPHFRRRRWSVAAAYGQSKLADMLWALELDARLRSIGRDVTVQLAHPGWALTNLQNATSSARLNAVITRACSLYAQPAPAACAGPPLCADGRLSPLILRRPRGSGSSASARRAPTCGDTASRRQRPRSRWISRRSRLVGRPAPRSRTATGAGRSSLGGGGGDSSIIASAASGALTRLVSSCSTTRIRGRTPPRTTTRSPMRTTVAGLARTPPTCTWPPLHAAVASERLLNTRTAHNQASTRTLSLPDTFPRVAPLSAGRVSTVTPRGRRQRRADGGDGVGPVRRAM